MKVPSGQLVALTRIGGLLAVCVSVGSLVLPNAAFAQVAPLASYVRAPVHENCCVYMHLIAEGDQPYCDILPAFLRLPVSSAYECETLCAQYAGASCPKPEDALGYIANLLKLHGDGFRDDSFFVRERHSWLLLTALCTYGPTFERIDEAIEAAIKAEREGQNDLEVIDRLRRLRGALHDIFVGLADCPPKAPPAD